jgi:hypothetical protein
MFRLGSPVSWAFHGRDPGPFMPAIVEGIVPALTRRRSKGPRDAGTSITVTFASERSRSAAAIQPTSIRGPGAVASIRAAIQGNTRPAESFDSHRLEELGCDLTDNREEFIRHLIARYKAGEFGKACEPWNGVRHRQRQLQHRARKWLTDETSLACKTDVVRG